MTEADRIILETDAEAAEFKGETKRLLDAIDRMEADLAERKPLRKKRRRPQRVLPLTAEEQAIADNASPELVARVDALIARYREKKFLPNGDRRDSFVYFVRAKDGSGPIKIGMSRTPEARLRDIQTHHPVPLEIVFKIPGARRTEKWFHARFAHLRLNGEWFDAGPDLLKDIERRRALTADDLAPSTVEATP